MKNTSTIRFAKLSTVFALLAFFIPLRSVAQEHKFININTGKEISVANKNDVICFNEEEIAIAITDAEDTCSWTFPQDGYLKFPTYEGRLKDTVRLLLDTKKVGNNSVSLNIGVSWRKPGGGVYSTSVTFVVSPRAAEPGNIDIFNSKGDYRIGHNKGKEVYCESLTYRLNVAKGQPRDYAESMPLQYAFYKADTTDDKITGSRVRDFMSGEGMNIADARVFVTDTGRYWMVRAKTCDAGMETKPSFRKIENVIPKNILDDTVDLTLKQIRYMIPKTEDGGGSNAPQWIPVNEGKDDKINACVYYSSKFNGNKNNYFSESKNDDDTENGYIDFEAGPFDIKEDILFPHYRFRWKFDTADLEFATDKMKAEQGNIRHPDLGFGTDRSRVCFRVKENKKGASRGKIFVSVEVYCPECEAEAREGGKTGDEAIYEKKSKVVELIRVDSLPGDLTYTTTLKDKWGNEIEYDKETEMPEICGNRENLFCAAVAEDYDYDGKLIFTWEHPASWEPVDGKDGCQGLKTPEIPFTETQTGQTYSVYVYPRNACFINGSKDIHRDTVKVYVKALLPAPRIYDPLDIRNPNFTGVKKEDIQEDNEKDKFDERPSILLCNYNKTYDDYANRDYYLVSKGSAIKPQLSDGQSEGYVIERPDGFSSEDITFSIKPLVKDNTEANDTNIVTITVKQGAYERLKGKTQLAFGFASANECGAGTTLYFPVNIIDTLTVFGHVKHTPNDDQDPGMDSLAWACEGEIWKWELEGEEKMFYTQPVPEVIENEGGGDDGMGGDGSGTVTRYKTGAARNTDRVEHEWSFDPTWRFSQKNMENQNPTSVRFGQFSGQVKLALRNRCGLGKERGGDYVNVNPYTRVKIKVTGTTTEDALNVAYDPKEASEFLVQPCRGSSLVYAADTSYLTEEYLWCFPDDWKVLPRTGYETATWIGEGDSANYARTKNTDLQNPVGGVNEMRVMVQVGADTGDIMVIGRKAGCYFYYDNVAPDPAREKLKDGHRADTLHVFVRPFTGKPSLQDWPSRDLCAHTTQMLVVKPDPTQDAKTRQETHFTWSFPEDWNVVSFINERKDTVLVKIPNRITEERKIGEDFFRSDTVRVYSHRYDCEETNKGDSTLYAFRLVDTLSLNPKSTFTDLLREEALNTSPCEGDTVEYTLTGAKFHDDMDSIVFRWSFAKDLNGVRTFVTGDSIDLTGWRVLNAKGKYSSKPNNPTKGLKMVVGRAPIRILAYGAAHCGESSPTRFIDIKPISLVRDKAGWVEGGALVCEKERAVFRPDSVQFATAYEWHYPWGRLVDTIKADKNGYIGRYIRRTFSDTTTFVKGDVYVVPFNRCGMGPESDTITITDIIGDLKAPNGIKLIAANGIATEVITLSVVADTALDTVCLRNNYTYKAAYSDDRYPTQNTWKFDWFNLSEPFNDSIAMQAAPADSSEAIFFKRPDNTATSGFDYVNIGVRVRHQQCRRYGDTLTLKILPYDTAVAGSGLDYIVDLKTGKADIQTKPCGADTAMWMVNKAKFVPAVTAYQFVWGVDPKSPLGRNWTPADSTMDGSAFKWFSARADEGSNLDDCFYAADTLHFAIPNFALIHDSLYVSVNVKNRCGVSHLPSFLVKSEEKLENRDGLSIKANANFCDREKLIFVASANSHVNSRVWYYPWDEDGDTITGESHLESKPYSDSLQEGYVYFIPVNGCGAGPNSDSITIENIRRIPAQPRKPSLDSLCMNQPAWLKAEFPGGTDRDTVEILWRKLSGQAGASVFTPQQNTDSCRLAPTDVKADPLRISVKSRAKGCTRYSDSLVINITSLDTLAFVIPSHEEDEEESVRLGNFDLDLTQTLVADGKPVDLTPCADLALVYGIRVDPAKAWSLDGDFESYLSWNLLGAAPSLKPDADLHLGGSNWMFDDAAGNDTTGKVHYAQLPLVVGASDSLYFHVTLKNICGISHSPGLLIAPDRKVTQKPHIVAPPLCFGEKVRFIADDLEDVVESLEWICPWKSESTKTTPDYPYLNVTVGEKNGNVILWAGNQCEPHAMSDTLKVDAVMMRPNRPVPAWLPEGKNYTWNADTVVEYICLHGQSTLTVKPDAADSKNLQFAWKFMEGAGNMDKREASGASYILGPKATATLNDSALLAVCGNYPNCGDDGYYGDTLYIRLYLIDTFAFSSEATIFYESKGSDNGTIVCPEAELLLRVDNPSDMDVHHMSSYHWVLPGQGAGAWRIKDATDVSDLPENLQFPVPGDSNYSSIVAIVGETGGRVSVQRRTPASVLGCPYFSRPVTLKENFTVRSLPDAPAFTTFVEKPCVGQEVQYAISSIDGAKAYRWQVPADWRFKVNGGKVSHDTIWEVHYSETNATRCTVLVGKDTGYIRVWAIDSCNGNPSESQGMSRLAYPLDTARLTVVGGHSICIDSTMDLEVFSVAPYTLFSDVYYTLDVTGPGKNTFTYEGEVSQSIWTVVSHSFDTVYMEFTPVFEACPNNVETYVHYILADTTPEINGFITGIDTVCADNIYEYQFHLDLEMGELDITCTWEVSTDAWKVVETPDDTTVVLHFLGMPVDETTGQWSRETDTIICYPRGMCGTGLPIKLPIALREADPFADSVVVSAARPCVGTDIEVHLRDSALYSPYPDSIKFVWNTPDNWRRLTWDGLSEATDSLSATRYRVQLDTADAVIAVRMWRKGACGLSQTLRSTPIHVRDSAAKASVEASYMLSPCYTRPAYNIVLKPKDDVDSAVWTLPAGLTYSLSTRAVAAFKYDSLWIDNTGHSQAPISLPVRTVNECGHRDTVFVVRPITDIEKFTEPLQVPRLCFGDTAHAWITLPKKQIEQGTWYVWDLSGDTHTVLRQWNDTVAAMQFLVSPAGDSVHIQIIAVNDCAADSNQHADVAPYRFRIWPASDPDTAVYLQSGVKLLIDSVAPGKKDDYSYVWTPSNRVVDSIPATRTLVQETETFYVRARQNAAEGSENLPFYRRDRLCVADDSVKIVVDSVFGFVPLDADTICVDLTDSLFAVSFGGNRQNYHINWYEYIDNEWELIPEMQDSALFAPVFENTGTYRYRVVGFDSTFLHDEETEEVILIASHYDTLEIDVHVSDLQVSFRNIASDDVSVPMGGRVEFLTRLEDGSGRYHFEWTPESWVSSVDSTDGSMNTEALFHEGELTLTVTDSVSGCVRETKVRVKPGKGNDIPNVITPNGDGYNDIFLKGVSRLTIYTSWGEKIFHSEDGNGWDGSRNGQPVRPGEYLYVAEIDGEDGSVRTVKGVVTVKYE